MKSTGMVCDGIAASEAIDSSGEILDVAGCDISDFEEGKGTINWEHRGDDSEGASANDLVGRILFAKKIFSADDCSDDRQLQYYKELGLPYIYIIYRLFDGSGHPGATALAAIIRDCKQNGEKNLIGLSIEGTTLKKDGNRLVRSVARRVAATQKPCNKSALSNVISDPNGGEVEKKEAHPHPNFTQLTDSVASPVNPMIEAETLNKTLTAGNYNVAPSGLVGGSALQVEDRGLRNRVKAAVRDWDRVTPFKKFLKHRLPEASDEFVDRFAGLVQDYTIKKAQKDVLKAAVKRKIGQKLQAVIAAPPPPPEGSLTIRGQPIHPNPEGTKTAFDERTGMLHTPRGSFPMYIPSRDQLTPDAGPKFHAIMQDPKVSKAHDQAMENWVKVHQHLKAGTLPPEVVMHAVLFSQLSPNTPVPMQELMYGHLVDAMRSTKIDPRDPDSQHSDVLRQDWLNRDSPTQWPKHSREHYKRLENQLRLRNDSKDGPRKVGDIGSFMLANSKFDNMAKYHRLHPKMVDLVNRHRADARSAVEEMMWHKKQSRLWEAKRRRDLDKGLADPGDYNGPDVHGLAPKTARYTYGMLGGGNSMVPDTHFVRYLFGLDRSQDTETINYLKGLTWDPNNSHVLGALDRYYGKHHDAVKHMLAHPTWGKYFEKPEDAIFPAFWKNWVGILPHEAARGMKNFGWNEGTDHRPFWDAIKPYLSKSEMDTNLAMRTAKTHHEWSEKYGEMPAMFMYYHFLVPQLLEAGEKRTQGELTRKFESAAIDLQKAGEQPAAKPMHPETVRFNGKTVKPGRAYTDTENYYLLDHHPDHYVAVPQDKVYNWEPQDLIKLSRHGRLNYNVITPPEHLEAPSVISYETHTIPEYTHHQETKDLVHGLDLGASHLSRPENISKNAGINAHQSFWTKNAQGKRVYIKGAVNRFDEQNGDFAEPHREGLFHNLAKDFYGLGQYVVPTTPIIDPATGELKTVVEHFPGTHHDRDNLKHVAHLRRMWDSGELQKLAVMDLVNHSRDRHGFNFLLSTENGQPGLKLIDHGDAFTHIPMMPSLIPQYIRHLHGSLHPAVAKWISGLDPVELERQMRRHRVPENVISETSRRLRVIRSHVKLHHDTSTLSEALEKPFKYGR